MDLHLIPLLHLFQPTLCIFECFLLTVCLLLHFLEPCLASALLPCFSAISPKAIIEKKIVS